MSCGHCISARVIEGSDHPKWTAMLSRINFLFLVLLFDNSTSLNVIYEYEYPNRKAIQRQSEVYDNLFETEHSQLGTELYCYIYQEALEME